MCKGSFPELEFSDVRCTFRPSSSFESSQRCSSQHEKDVEDVHYLKRRTFCERKTRISSGGDGDGIPSTVPLNHVSIDVPSSGNKRQIRPKTARLASQGKSCTGLITLSLPREEKVQSIEHKTTGQAVLEDISSTTTTYFKMRPTTGREARLERISCNDLLPLTSSKQPFNSSNKGKKTKEMVVFLPTQRPETSTNVQIQGCLDQVFTAPLPDIGKNKETFMKEKENMPIELPQVSTTVQGSIGLPAIGKTDLTQKLRRTKSEGIEQFVRNANKDFDKNEAKAYLMYNWMKTQTETDQS